MEVFRLGAWDDLEVNVHSKSEMLLARVWKSVMGLDVFTDMSLLNITVCMNKNETIFKNILDMTN